VKINKQQLICLALIALIIIARMIPHVPNFTPVGAVILIAAIYLKGKNRWLVPLIGMLISDIFIGVYHLPIMISVYASLVMIYLVGLWIKKNRNFINNLTGILSASLLFFIITNFTVWYFGTWYAHDLSGLYLCYLMAIPFFKATLTGNLFYFAIIATAFELLLITKKKHIRHKITYISTSISH